MSWPEIASKLTRRTADQVRSRFSRTLDPSLKKNVPWTPEEDGILQRCQATWGNKWTEISKMLPGRSDNDTKNRWYNLKNQSARVMQATEAEIQRRQKLASLRADAVSNSGGEASDGV